MIAIHKLSRVAVGLENEVFIFLTLKATIASKGDVSGEIQHEGNGVGQNDSEYLRVQKGIDCEWGNEMRRNNIGKTIEVVQLTGGG